MVLLVEKSFIASRHATLKSRQTKVGFKDNNYIYCAYALIIIIVVCISFQWIGPQNIFIKENYLANSL